MTLDFTLEEHVVLDYVGGKEMEPPSSTHVVARMKYIKGEFKTKKILFDSI